MSPERTLLFCVVLTLPLACTRASTGPAPGGAECAFSDTAAPEAEQAPPEPAVLLFQATRTLDLDGDRRATVEALSGQLESSGVRVRAAFERLKVVLIDSVRAGAIDRAKVHEDEEVAVEALQVHADASIHALDALHALLDGPQRLAVVVSARDGWENAPLTPPMGGGPALAEQTIEARDRGRLDDLTSELGLDADQRGQVWTLISSMPSAMESPYATREQRAEALFVAFRAPTFDAKAVVLGPSETHARERIEARVAFLTDLLPILRPEQRERLVVLIDRRWTQR
jgi:hypothetical protein